jgi:hypothetical protein
MNREQILQIHAAARVIQARYDAAFEPWGVRAPEPPLGQDLDTYRRNLAVQAKRLLPENHQLRKVQYRGLQDDTLNAFEPQLLNAVRTHAMDNSTVPYDAPLRRVEVRDQNGLKVVNWIGQRSFIHDFTRPCRRAIIRTPDTHPGWFPKEIPSVWLTGRVKAA